jgi:hypothetical protein
VSRLKKPLPLWGSRPASFQEGLPFGSPPHLICASSKSSCLHLPKASFHCPPAHPGPLQPCGLGTTVNIFLRTTRRQNRWACAAGSKTKLSKTVPMESNLVSAEDMQQLLHMWGCLWPRGLFPHDPLSPGAPASTRLTRPCSIAPFTLGGQSTPEFCHL